MKNKNIIIKYIICMAFLFSVLYIIKNNYIDENNNIKNSYNIIKSSIIDKEENIYVNYPRFKDDDINKIITDYIYNYVKKFKKNKLIDKKLNINYEISIFDNYVNVVFYIENNTSKIKNHNIFINIKKKEISNITNIIDNNYLKNEIYSQVMIKYSTEIYELIKNVDINTFTYIIKDNIVLVYFNNINNLDEIPYVKIYLENKVAFNIEDKIKYVAFTFDDGPSKYSLDLLNVLNDYSCSATFFMIGNKLKDNIDIVNSIYNSDSEIASHSFSHIDLTKLSYNDILNELNTSTILFNSIINNNIKYLRPPYGKYNNNVLNASAYPIILWSIDTRDWKVKDSDRIVNTIIKNISDGDIVLMHDNYEETLIALKKVIPILKKMNYNVVSISKLLEIKNKKVYSGEVLDSIR